MSASTIRLRRIVIPSSALAALPDAERNLLFLAGHVLNELNSLNKVFGWCLHNSEKKQAGSMTGVAQGVQSMIFARLLAGKLWEAWDELQSSWFGSRLSKLLEPDLHPEAKRD